MTHIYQLNKYDMQIQLHILIQNTEFIEKKYLSPNPILMYNGGG